MTSCRKYAVSQWRNVFHNIWRNKERLVDGAILPTAGFHFHHYFLILKKRFVRKCVKVLTSIILKLQHQLDMVKVQWCHDLHPVLDDQLRRVQQSKRSRSLTKICVAGIGKWRLTRACSVEQASVVLGEICRLGPCSTFVQLLLFFRTIWWFSYQRIKIDIYLYKTSS